MPDGFKLLDAYVEVTASGKGLASRVASDFESEAPAAAKRSSASFGSALLSNFSSLTGNAGKSLLGSVESDVTKSMKSMSDAVDKASLANVAAKKREADTTGSLRIAELALSEARKKYPADSLQLISAEERFAAAQRNSVAAVESSKRSMSTLGEAQRKMAAQVAENSKPSASWGSSLLGDFKGFAMNAVGGLVGGLVAGVTSFAMSAIGNTVSAISGMITNIGQVVASTVIDFNSTLQNATIGFTTMLGSGTKSAEFLNKLQDFAKSTPFEFKNLIANAQNMMGMGIAAKDVIPDLTALGDSVASIGGNAAQVDQVTLAFDQMAAKGTLDMGNMNQLMQGGVPSALKIMAAAYKTTTGNMIGMISTGKVQANVALPALIKGLEQGTKSTAALGGMMAKQSFTFTGALSNIQDGLTQTVSKAFKPFFDVASKGMQRFATSLSGKPADKFQKEVTKAIQPLARDISRWFNGIDFDKIFANAGSAVKGFGKFLRSKDFADFVGQMKDIAKSVQDAAPVILKAIKDLGPGFLGMIKWAVDTTSAFADGASQWTSIIGGFAKWFTDTFVKLPAQLEVIGAQIVAGFIGGIEGAWGAVTSTVSNLVNMIPAGVRNILGIASPSKVFHTIGTQVGEGLHKGLLGSVDQIKGASNTLADAVRSAFSSTNMTSSQEKSALGRIKEMTRELVSTAKDRDKAVTALSAAKDKLSGLKADKAAYGAGVATSARSGFDIGTIYSNGIDAMSTWQDKTNTYTTALADYNKGLADAKAKDMASSMIAAGGLLNGAKYQASYTTQGGGTNVADYMRDNAAPVNDAGAKPLTGIALVKSNLKKILTDTKAFTANLKKLVKMGLDKITLQQLIDAGPTAGLEITKDMIADPAGLKSIVNLQKQITTADNSLGGYAAGQFYDKQIGSAQRAVNQDKRLVNQFNVTMVVEANKIDEVQKMINTLTALKSTAKAAKAKK